MNDNTLKDAVQNDWNRFEEISMKTKWLKVNFLGDSIGPPLMV
ncbi:MAG: hypothetical protein ACTSXD_01540 [Candidatus Heimdallarchaeaceae archaeon]